ncbi:MucB/RseB C-terminal domain-containing protein [Variovorax sp. J22P240]|uniref:MucB/RseB C-terminal domain-containing protein n=1 Tax=Variovorax sp. J22P240 TaxID=3053514 RepID=UPI002574F799|nr:MucB/RseB C-terminal domain-containing protein [Variovorax sp. J22P240]MDL9998411.1 MucB/RseB C-terminal domain-containing protein [Variovorax sp. J22P240]
MIVPMPIPVRGFLTLMAALCMAQAAVAQSRTSSSPPKTPSSSNAAGGEAPTLSVVEWLQRMHTASRQRSYIGTFVVSAATGTLSSARIWHVSEGDLQMERIEALSGPPRSTFRRNDKVVTFLPESKVVKSERRENLELFPNLLGNPDSSIAALYGVRVIGKDRVAGFDADVVQVEPRDGFRFGYRVWSERRSGLVVKLQTIDGESKVIEQSAFSELQLDAPIKTHALTQMMSSTAGYRVEKSELERTTAQSEGWSLKAPVAGFKPINCYRRSMGGDARGHTMQWTFSDGLASVSLFVEPYDAQRKPREVLLALGATYTLTRRLVDKDGDWWLTAVGEVPPETLDAFAQSLTRAR